MSSTVFFHSSEAPGESLDSLWIGAPVEFVLQNRQGKDVATQIRLLPPGSVNFDVRIYVCKYVCMYVCMQCMYVCVYSFLKSKLFCVHIHICACSVYIRTYLRTYVHIIHTYVCICRLVVYTNILYVHIYVPMYIWALRMMLLYKSIHTYVRGYIHVCMCLHIHKYVYYCRYTWVYWLQTLYHLFTYSMYVCTYVCVSTCT